MIADWFHSGAFQVRDHYIADASAYSRSFPCMEAVSLWHKRDGIATLWYQPISAPYLDGYQPMRVPPHPASLENNPCIPSLLTSDKVPRLLSEASQQMNAWQSQSTPWREHSGQVDHGRDTFYSLGPWRGQQQIWVATQSLSQSHSDPVVPRLAWWLQAGSRHVSHGELGQRWLLERPESHLRSEVKCHCHWRVLPRWSPAPTD